MDDSAANAEAASFTVAAVMFAPSAGVRLPPLVASNGTVILRICSFAITMPFCAAAV
jgi:hypothetical protein